MPPNVSPKGARRTRPQSRSTRPPAPSRPTRTPSMACLDQHSVAKRGLSTPPPPHTWHDHIYMLLLACRRGSLCLAPDETWHMLWKGRRPRVGHGNSQGLNLTKRSGVLSRALVLWRGESPQEAVRTRPGAYENSICVSGARRMQINRRLLGKLSSSSPRKGAPCARRQGQCKQDGVTSPPAASGHKPPDSPQVARNTCSGRQPERVLYGPPADASHRLVVLAPALPIDPPIAPLDLDPRHSPGPHLKRRSFLLHTDGRCRRNQADGESPEWSAIPLAGRWRRAAPPGESACGAPSLCCAPCPDNAWRRPKNNATMTRQAEHGHNKLCHLGLHTSVICDPWFEVEV